MSDSPSNPVSTFYLQTFSAGLGADPVSALTPGGEELINNFINPEELNNNGNFYPNTFLSITNTSKNSEEQNLSGTVETKQNFGFWFLYYKNS